MASIRRKSAAVALAVVGVAGLTLASAAQLTVNTSSLGAGTDVVASCDDAIDVDFANTYDATTKTYRTTAVTLSDVAAACDDLAISITVADSAGASIATFNGQVGDAYTLSTPVPAASVANVAVVIAG